MKNNIIEFSAHEEYFKFKDEFPKPIKLNIPEWFKKLNTSLEYQTVKGCVPFLQTLTSGYLLTLPQDFHLQHNSSNKEFVTTNLKASMRENDFNLNTEGKAEQHPTKQITDSPHSKKNSYLPVNKFLNPWKIKTPPGYSCLFVPPLNNSDERFSIIPGIVDTDTFDLYINFPFVVNGDKFPVLDTELKKGTPYVKRDSWKMNIKPINQNKNSWINGKYFLKKLHNYKNTFWNKDVTWK